MGAGLKNKAGNFWASKSGAQKRKEAKERCDNEWDIRVTIREDYTVSKLMKKLHKNEDKIRWYLIAGEEIGMAEQEKGTTDPDTGKEIKKYPHHHVGLVLKDETMRSDVLKMVGKTIGEGVYAMPRDRTKTYEGWVIHHTKEKTKSNPEERIVKEWGTRPVDYPSEENHKKTKAMAIKYGDIQTKIHYGTMPRGAKREREEQKEENKRKRLKKANEEQIEKYRKKIRVLMSRKF